MPHKYKAVLIFITALLISLIPYIIAYIALS